MKKIIAVGVVLGLLVAGLFTAQATAYSCCDCGTGCCWQMCCEHQTQTYKVSYFERVKTGSFFQGVETVRGVWTSKTVVAHNSTEAANMLGLRAGYNCFVGCIVG